MVCITRHDRRHAGSRNFGHVVDSNLKLALDHFVDFFRLMEVFVNG